MQRGLNNVLLEKEASGGCKVIECPKTGSKMKLPSYGKKKINSRNNKMKLMKLEDIILGVNCF